MHPRPGRFLAGLLSILILLAIALTPLARSCESLEKSATSPSVLGNSLEIPVGPPPPTRSTPYAGPERIAVQATTDGTDHADVQWVIQGRVCSTRGQLPSQAKLSIRVLPANADAASPMPQELELRDSPPNYEISLESFRRLHPYERSRTSIVVVASTDGHLPLRSDPINLGSLDPFVSARLVCDLTLTPATTLRCLVETLAGSPVEGAFVRFLDPSPPGGTTALERTNAEGHCLIAANILLPGLVQASHPHFGCGHVSLPMHAALSPGEPLRIVLRGGHTLRARLLFPDGSPIRQQGFHVRLDESASSGVAQTERFAGVSAAHGTTDAGGRFLLMGLRQGRYRVTPQAIPVDGSNPAIRSATLLSTDSDEVDLRLDLRQVAVEVDSDDPRRVRVVRILLETWEAPPCAFAEMLPPGTILGDERASAPSAGAELDLDLAHARFLVSPGCWLFAEIAGPSSPLGGRALLHVNANQYEHRLRVQMGVADLSALLRFDVRDPAGKLVQGCAIAIEAGITNGGRLYRRIRDASGAPTFMTAAGRLWITISPPLDDRMLLPASFAHDARPSEETLVSTQLVAGGRLRFQPSSPGHDGSEPLEHLVLQLTSESDPKFVRTITTFQEGRGVTNAHRIVPGHHYVVPLVLGPGWYRAHFAVAGHSDWQMPVLLRPGEFTDLPVDFTPR